MRKQTTSLWLYILSITLSFGSSQLSADDNVIFWQIYHRPPGIFTEGEFAGQGFVQNALREVTQRLTNYQHVMVTTSLARALKDIQNGKQVCHPALFKTKERQKFATFSKASIVHPTNRIVMRASLAKHLGLHNDAVDLTALLSRPDITAALIDGRLFGVGIDTIMSGIDLQQRLVLIPSENLDNMLNMVSLGRADITIAYPFEVEHFNQSIAGSFEPLRSFRIETVVPYSMGYIACPNNVWGNAVIKQIDAILETQRQTKEYKSAVTAWWEKDASTTDFDTYYDTVFLKN